MLNLHLPRLFKCPSATMNNFSLTWLLLLSCWSSHVFCLSDFINYSPLCGRWSFFGNLTLNPNLTEHFGSKLTIQMSSGNWETDTVHTTRRICDIDLNKPPCQRTNSDMCHVIHTYDDVYTIGVNRKLQASDSGLTVEAVQFSQTRGIRTYVVTTLGRLPDAKSAKNIKTPEMTYQIGEEAAQNLDTDSALVNVSMCANQFVPVKFCKTNAPEELKLKITWNGQETESLKSCVEVGYRYNNSMGSINSITFKYQDTICDYSKDFKLAIRERATELCDICIPPVSFSSSSACVKRPNSKAREIVTLKDDLEVMCDTETDGGNWIIFQRRISPEVDFYLPWENYTAGFGDISTNFWLGLNNIHNLCPQSNKCELRIDFLHGGKKYHVTYQDFYLGGPTDKFRLHIGKYTGNAGDDLAYHNNAEFHTKDRDTAHNCANKYKGAWWYVHCYNVNFNGFWATNDDEGMRWWSLGVNSVTFDEMKLRIYS